MKKVKNIKVRAIVKSNNYSNSSAINSRRWCQPGGGNKWQLCNQILLNSSLLFAAPFGSIQFRQIWHQAPSLEDQ